MAQLLHHQPLQTDSANNAHQPVVQPPSAVVQQAAAMRHVTAMLAYTDTHCRQQGWGRGRGHGEGVEGGGEGTGEGVKGEGDSRNARVKAECKGWRVGRRHRASQQRGRWGVYRQALELFNPVGAGGGFVCEGLRLALCVLRLPL